MGWKILSLFCIAATFVEAEKICERYVNVATSSGVVRGCYTSERTIGQKKQIYWFRSIPYAEPPVGDLRFEAPQPKKKWIGVKDVSEKMPECIQGSENVIGSEDCLYLKVYTTRTPTPTNNLPVMVWIYGGAFFAGSADFSDHFADYLLDEDVLVVSFHHRVGIMGFLSTGDAAAPGNSGLKDMVLALKWIKENIGNFGGDPDRITLFGQSAGAASISYLLQAEQAKGLFQKAILQSGSSLSPWSLSRSSLDLAKVVADTLKINNESTEDLVKGLKKVDAKLLQSTSYSEMLKLLMKGNPLHGLVFGPVIEPNNTGAIITGKSHELLSKGDFNAVPLMVGYTSLEAMIDSLSVLVRFWLAKYDVRPTLLVPEDMNTRATTRPIVASSIKSRYFGLSPVSTSYKKVMTFISHDQFERPIQEAIRLYQAKTDVYFYRFAYEGALYGVTNRPADGVGHTEDLGYLFEFGHNGTTADRRVRAQMVRMWTNFAKYGNPTPQQESLLDGVQWTANRRNPTGDLVCLNVDGHLANVAHPNGDDMHFWSSLYARYGRPPFETY